MPQPSSDQEKLLAALTLACMQRLGAETLPVEADDNLRKLRSARVGNVMLQEWPADAKLAKQINVYWVDGDKYFQSGPERLLYSLQWRHNPQPPDFHLQLVKDEPELWVHFVNAALLGELQKQDPHLLDGLHAG